MEESRRQLTLAATRYRKALTSEPIFRNRKKRRADDWTKVAKLSDELIHLLSRLERPPPPHPDGSPRKPIWHEELSGLKKLNAAARRFAEPSAKKTDELPKATPSVWFQFNVLENWTLLGGKLKLSRNHKNKVSGPLARYFSAAAHPVLGGSLESLPDILERHKDMRLANNKERISRIVNSLDPPLEHERSRQSLEAVGLAEAMAIIAKMEWRLERWARQDDVRALLKEAIAEWADQGVLEAEEAAHGEEH